MAEQYWIGGFFIDLSRNQITQNKQSQTLAPKALSVITCLAENQGKVVSHDALLAKVWQGTVVSPNTLQRSIAQLRKALGDDGKVYIKTHAKQGYSLECEVRWQDSIESTLENKFQPHSKQEEKIEAKIDTIIDTEKDSPRPHASQENEFSKSIINTDVALTDRAESSKSKLSLVIAAVAIIMLAIIGYQYFSAKEISTFSIKEIRTLTATDNKELAGIYSPDGQYIVFLRYSEQFCMNNLWAKHTETQEEIQLTKKLGSYGNHSFSKDGKKLVFIESANCNEPITQKKCYKLMSFDFQQALKNPLSPSILMECKNSKISSPIWLNNNNIALLQLFSNRWQLTSYSIVDNKSHVLYTPEEGNIIDYDYSATNDLIALTSVHNDGHYYIEMLKPDGQLLSSHRIKYPKEIAKFRFIYPNFSPVENQLIFSTGRQLFTLSYDGQVSKINLPLDQPMGTPVFHPDGKRMAVIKGHYDSDILSVPLLQFFQDKTEKPQSNKTENNSVLARSIFGEENAIFQPNGEFIAYESDRSGEEQIWLTDGLGSQQLTHFPMDSYIQGFDWSADGKSILVSVNSELKQIYLDGREKNYSLKDPLHYLFQWDSNNQTALMVIRIKGILKFVELDLTNTQISIIKDNTVQWALKSDNGQLIYIDYMDRFWQPGPAEDRLIEALNDQGSDKRFLIRGDVIYGVNDKFQLWSYDLNEDKFDIIGELPNNVDDVTDIDQIQLLMTVRISAKKEVAELTLNE